MFSILDFRSGLSNPTRAARSEVSPQQGPNPAVSDHVDVVSPSVQSKSQAPAGYDLGIPPLEIYGSLAELKRTLDEYGKCHGYEMTITSCLRNKSLETCRLDLRCKRHGRLDNKRRLADHQRVRLGRASFKIDCKFALVASAVTRAQAGGPWHLRRSGRACAETLVHNHPADDVLVLSGHRRRDVSLLEDTIIAMHVAGTKPAAIMAVLEGLHKDKTFTIKDIYNIIRKWRLEQPHTTTTPPAVHKDLGASRKRKRREKEHDTGGLLRQAGTAANT